MHIVIDGSIWENNSFSIINRNLACALYRLGYDVRLNAWEQGREKPHREAFIDLALLDHLASIPRQYDDAVTIRQSWPRCEPHYSEFYNWDTIRGRVKIGLLPWESEHLPVAWLDNMRRVDAVLAISPFSAARLERELRNYGIMTPVWNSPLGVDRRLFHEGRLHTTRVYDARYFRFLHVGVGQPRKGSDLLRAAYLKEFTYKDEVTLVVKTGGWDSVAWWTKNVSPDTPHILAIHDDNIPESEMGGFYTACHCLVHPSRLEGFGMTMLEAMSCGLQVICPEVGAHRVFATPENAILVSGIEEQFGYFQDLVGTAYCVDEEALRKAMRQMYETRHRNAGLARAAGINTAREFSWERCAQRIVERIERSYESLVRT